MALTEYLIAEDKVGNSWHEKSIGVDSNGRIYVGYTRDISGTDTPKLAYSDDDGETWTEIAEAIDYANYDFVSIFVDSGNNVHCSYGNDSGLVNSLRYRKLNSDLTWETAETIYTDAGTNPSRYSVVMVDSGGEVWVLSTRQETTWKIRVAKRDGGSWTSDSGWTLTGPAGYEHYHLTAVIDSSDHIHMAYSERSTTTTTNLKVAYNDWDTSAESWAGKTIICNNVYEAKRHPTDIVVLTSGDIWVVWDNDGYGVNNTKKQIIYNVKSSGSWAGATNMTDETNHQELPRMCTDGTNVVISYCSMTIDPLNAVYNMAYMSYDGSTWVGPVQITAGALNNYPMACLFQKAGTYQYTYVELDTGVLDYYDAHDTGGVALDATVTVSNTPNIVFADYNPTITTYSTPQTEATDFGDMEFTLLEYGDTGMSDPVLIINFSHIYVQVAATGASDVHKLYVSNDGTNYALRETFTGPGTLGFYSSYKYLKVERVSGDGNVKVICQMDAEFDN